MLLRCAVILRSKFKFPGETTHPEARDLSPAYSLAHGNPGVHPASASIFDHRFTKNTTASKSARLTASSNRILLLQFRFPDHSRAP